MFVDWLAKTDWSNFASTLLATLAGALVALIGTAAVAARDRRERYGMRLDEALGHVLTASTAYLNRAAQYAEDVEATRGGPYGRLVSQPVLPSPIELEGALAVVSLVAKGTDRQVTDWLELAFRNATQGDEPDVAIVRTLPRAILKWRRGEKRTVVLEEVIVRNGAQ